MGVGAAEVTVMVACFFTVKEGPPAMAETAVTVAVYVPEDTGV